MIVVDTNIISYLYLEGEHSARSVQVVRADPVWAAPVLWRSEMRSVLRLYIAKKIIPLETAKGIMREAERLLQGNEHLVPSDRVLELSASSGCSAYDCEFVALAERLSVPLVTGDRALLKAFPGTALSPSRFIADRSQ